MKFRKNIKIISVTTSVLLILMFLLPVIFPKTISEKAKELLNKTITGKLDFQKVSLSFFEHFPNLTVSIYNFSLTGSAPFEKDTLVSRSWDKSNNEPQLHHIRRVGKTF